MTPAELARVAATRRALADGTARRVREASGLSLNELAAGLGMPASALSRWETGKARPRADGALAYADVLAVVADLDPETVWDRRGCT